MKRCFKCGETKQLSMFHKHNKMKDGRINKCSSCVVLDVSTWRQSNPNARKEEHKRTYISKRKEPIKGRKVTALNYAHKRRLQTETQLTTELDSLVFLEAVDVRDKRKYLTNVDWHIDHIVPLNHKQACGLHNAFNLQVVPAKWNVRKQASNMNAFWISGY
jgi:hypothetical protein